MRRARPKGPPAVSESFCTYVAIWRPDDERGDVEPSGDPVWRLRGDAVRSILCAHPDGLRIPELRTVLEQPEHAAAKDIFANEFGRVRWLMVVEAVYWLWNEELVERSAEGRFRCV